MEGMEALRELAAQLAETVGMTQEQMEAMLRDEAGGDGSGSDGGDSDGDSDDGTPPSAQQLDDEVSKVAD
jgi:hypothetical protein